MIERQEQGSLVSMICDSGDRYTSTYYNPEWLKRMEIDIEPYRHTLETFLDTGTFTPDLLMT
jgi:cysteine synthase A